VVVLEEAIAEFTAGRLALEIGMGECRMVSEGKWHVEKERPVTSAIFRDVVDGMIRHHPVDQSARVFVVQPHVMRLLAFPGLADVVHILEGHVGVRGPVDDVGGLEAEPFVEALVGRQAAFSGAQVPLAKHCRAVACVAQHLGDRDLPRV
jgi:hypothetical protein